MCAARHRFFVDSFLHTFQQDELKLQQFLPTLGPRHVLKEGKKMAAKMKFSWWWVATGLLALVIVLVLARRLYGM